MEKMRVFIFLGLSVVMLASCSKKSAPTPPPPDTTKTVSPPGKTVLSTPANNEPCIVGTPVSGNKSTVTFSWQQGAYTDTYDVHIKNLITHDTVVVSTARLTADVNMALATPYSWYIIAKSKKSTQTAQSDTWKFYNSGPGVTVYPPYPAEAVYPALQQTIAFPVGVGSQAVTIKWKTTPGSSPIQGYTLYCNNLLYNLTSPFAQIVPTTTNSGTVTCSTGTTYYWEVVTTDAAGNTSTSQVYSFYVE